MRKFNNTKRGTFAKLRQAAAVMLIICLVVSFATGCTTYDNFKNAFLGGSPEVKEPTIKIGVYEPLSGAYKKYGKEEAAGIELAHQLYPTVLGKEVELIYSDNRSNMYDAETALQELMSQNPVIVLGSYGEVLSLTAADYMVAASTPAIAITSTNPLITTNNDFYFTATFSASRQSAAMAEYAYTALNKTTFATVKSVRDDSATEIIKRFNNRVKKLTGGDEAQRGNYVIDAEASSDFSACIDQLITNQVETVLLAIPPAVAQTFMTQCLDKQYFPQFLGTREWDTEEFASFLVANPDLSVSYPSVQAADTTAMYQTFMDAYANQFGATDNPSGAAAAAFDAYLIAIKAIEDAYQNVTELDLAEMKAEAGSDPKAKAEVQAYETTLETGIPSGTQVRDAIKEIDDFEGATGILSYDGNNEVTKTVTIIHYFKGERMAPYSLF